MIYWLKGLTLTDLVISIFIMVGIFYFIDFRVLAKQLIYIFFRLLRFGITLLSLSAIILFTVIIIISLKEGTEVFNLTPIDFMRYYEPIFFSEVQKSWKGLYKVLSSYSVTKFLVFIFLTTAVFNLIFSVIIETIEQDLYEQDSYYKEEKEPKNKS